MMQDESPSPIVNTRRDAAPSGFLHPHTVGKAYGAAIIVQMLDRERRILHERWVEGKEDGDQPSVIVSDAESARSVIAFLSHCLNTAGKLGQR